MYGYNFLIRYGTFIFQTKGVKPFVISFLLLICIHSSVCGQSSTELSEVIKQYDQAVKNKDYKKASQYAYDIAKYYSSAKDINKAIDYLNHALAYTKKSGDLSLHYAVSHQLGTSLIEVKKYPKALENFLSALDVARHLKDITLIKEALINVSISYSYTARYKKSIEHAEEALALAIDKNDLVLQKKCYQLLAEYYNKQGNNRKSAEYQAQYNLLLKSQENQALQEREVKELKKHIEIVGLEKSATQSKLTEQSKKLALTNDSLRIIESSLRITTDSLKVIEEISRSRELEIDLLQKDKELADVKIKEQETRIENEMLVRNFIIVGSLLSVALIVVLIISYRKKNKDNARIDLQNKNIKSSINYAKRIQEAMLPKIDHQKIFKNAFILFKPRDIVSGDFYWFTDIKNGTSNNGDIAFAAVDCTGHGVPGAFMSMIGINALNGLVNKGVTETNKILDSLDHEIRTALQQDSSGNNDGMDIALCIYRKSRKVIEFSGAKNPLVYIQDNELFQIKGDIHSIGGIKHKNEFLFKKHEIAIDKPTVVYLFSDGYKDQFGGKDNGKFLAKRLNKLLLEIHQLPMQEQMDVLQTTIESWKGIRPQTDDILVMGLKLEPN